MTYVGSSEPRNDWITLVGLNGEVRTRIDIVTKPSISQMEVNPKVIIWRESLSSKVIWIEHVLGSVPEVVHVPQGFLVNMRESRASGGRKLTKVLIERCSSIETTATSKNTLGFRCNDEYAEVEVISHRLRSHGALVADSSE